MPVQEEKDLEIYIVGVSLQKSNSCDSIPNIDLNVILSFLCGSTVSVIGLQSSNACSICTALVLAIFCLLCFPRANISFALLQNR